MVVHYNRQSLKGPFLFSSYFSQYKYLIRTGDGANTVLQLDVKLQSFQGRLTLRNTMKNVVSGMPWNRTRLAKTNQWSTVKAATDTGFRLTELATFLEQGSLVFECCCQDTLSQF